MRNHLLNVYFIILSFSLFGQNFTAIIVDDKNKPIPYAAIQTGLNKGVISNEEGVFSFILDNTISNITISCLGYETKTISIRDIESNNYLISLKSSINELSTVYLSNKKLNIDSIIAKTNRNLKSNYKANNKRFKLFYRETSYVDFNKLDFNINRTSQVKKKQLISVNNDLDNMANEVMSSNTMHFIDYLGEISILDHDNYKMSVDKATQIINSKKDFSIENIQERAQSIILKYLDTTLTYKIKSGLFKVEDSLSLADSNNKDSEKNEFEISDLKSKASNMLKDTSPNSESFLSSILNSENYKYELQDITYQEEETIYIIKFVPKRSKSKYTGLLYISQDTYAVLKLDYNFYKGKRGSKLNLRLILGVKYIENKSTGTIIFKRNIEGWYEPRYIKEETGQYFYVNRPIKFIENSKERNKVLFNFIIEGDVKQNEELLITNTESISNNDFEKITEVKAVPYNTLRKYDASFWESNETIAPTEELKKFDATKN